MDMEVNNKVEITISQSLYLISDIKLLIGVEIVISALFMWLDEMLPDREIITQEVQSYVMSFAKEKLHSDSQFWNPKVIRKVLVNRFRYGVQDITYKGSQRIVSNTNCRK